MTNNTERYAPANSSRGPLAARRIVLMISVAVLGGSTLFAGGFAWSQAPAAAPSATTTVMRPATFADIVEKVKPAVFAVRVKSERGAEIMSFDDNSPFGSDSRLERFLERFGLNELPEQFKRFGFELPDRSRPERPRRFGMSQGSGFFISADGYAVTNNHVVDRGETVEIKTEDGKTYEAKVVGTDPRTDLALIKVDGRDDFPYVRFAEQRPRIGDWVLAVGNPFGLGGTVTAGIISASGRNIGAGPYDDFLQIDAPVNKGNSGGPTFNARGEVVGVNTAIYSPSGGNVGIAFAIPAGMVQDVVAELKEKGVVTRGWIGVQIQPVTADIAESLGLKDAKGALVAEVIENGPAAKSGLEPGDVIVSVAGASVKDARDLARKIGRSDPDLKVDLGVFRDGRERTFALTLDPMPNERAARADKGAPRFGNRDVPRLGLSLAPSEAGDGVMVTDVEPTSPAAERGVRQGDRILEVAGKKVRRPDDVREALEDARAQDKRSVLMRLKSGERTRYVAVPVNRA
jgi:serine protease Do